MITTTGHNNPSGINTHVCDPEWIRRKSRISAVRYGCVNEIQLAAKNSMYWLEYIGLVHMSVTSALLCMHTYHHGRRRDRSQTIAFPSGCGFGDNSIFQELPHGSPSIIKWSAILQNSSNRGSAAIILIGP